MIALSPRQRRALFRLARVMDREGFAADEILDFLESDGDGWRSAGDFIAATRRDVANDWRDRSLEAEDDPGIGRAFNKVDRAITRAERAFS